MHEIHPKKAEKFFWEKGNIRPNTLNQIYEKLPGYKIDEFFFEPCGYSMNGIKDENYETIHVTPEGACSYISFETNDKIYLNNENKESNIAEIFKPYSCATIEIRKNNGIVDNLKNDIIRNYSLISSDFITFGNINIEFHYYETNEMHPMVIVAKRRLERIALMKDVKSLKVS